MYISLLVWVACDIFYIVPQDCIVALWSVQSKHFRYIFTYSFFMGRYKQNIFAS